MQRFLPDLKIFALLVNQKVKIDLIFHILSPCGSDDTLQSEVHIRFGKTFYD